MIHETVKIGQYCVIGNDVEIAEGVIIGDFVTIKGDTKIGKGCYIGSYSILDSCYLLADIKLQGRNRIGPGSIIENDVEIKYNAILTSHARVGANTFIGVSAITLGSDVERVQVQGTKIGEGCYIGGQALIAPGVVVPDNTVLGANSFLKEVDGPGTYVGSPAKKIK